MFEHVKEQQLSNFESGREFLRAFPTTIYSFRKLLGVNKHGKNMGMKNMGMKYLQKKIPL